MTKLENIKMRKNLLSIAFIFLFTISSFSQIEMGKIEKAVEKENKIAFPAYDNLENFINHSDYYRAKTTKILESGSGKNPFDEKECEEKEYYKRYNGLNIYYPSFSNDYKKNSIQFLPCSLLNSTSRFFSVSPMYLLTTCERSTWYISIP